MNESNNNTDDESRNDSSALEALNFEVPTKTKESKNDYSLSNKLELFVDKLIGRNKANNSNSKWWHSQFNLMVAVFALLAIAVSILIFVSPSPEIDKAKLIAESSKGSVLPSSEAPWSQSQRAQARSDSQAILSNLLDSKKELLTMEVNNWAPESFQQALETATQGDDFYTQHDYAQAITSYQSAVDQMNTLYDLLPKLITARLEEANEAINAGKSSLAKELFNQVLQLDNTNLLATTGLDRASKLDQVLELLTKANVDEREYLLSGSIEDLVAAEKKLQQAKTIDEHFQETDEAIARVQNEIIDKRFKLAMSEAYQALFSNQFNTAQKAFARALTIKPGDSSAALAQQQALASDVTTTLSSLIRNAKSYEANEEWASAQSNYQMILQRDPNQINAKMGDIRSGARNQLDRDIREVLNDTLTFSRPEIKRKVALVLKDAKAIRNKGTKLQVQISELETALSVSNKSLKVRLLSDNLTDISFQKRGSKIIKLGSFKNKNMALKPGRYIATGVRLGYRDIRIEIELLPSNESIQSFTIICKELVRSIASTIKN